MSTLYVDNLRSNLSTQITVPSGNTLDVSGGTLLPSAGQVIQVKQATSTASQAFNLTLATGTTIFTGPTITPTSSSSKFLVMAQHSTELATGTSGSTASAKYIFTSIYEGSTQLATNGHSGSLANAHGHYSPVNSRQGASGSLLYSPNTTSSLTFYIKCSGGSDIGTAHWIFYGCAMTVMEIAG